MLRPDFEARALFLINVMFVVVVMLLAATLHGTPRGCTADEGMQLWNTFANDANRYTQTLEANLDRKAKARAKLAREWEAWFDCD